MDKYDEKAVEVMSIKGVICPQDIAAALREADKAGEIRGKIEAYDDVAAYTRKTENLNKWPKSQLWANISVWVEAKAAALRKSGE